MRLIKLTMPGNGDVYIRADQIAAVSRLAASETTEVVMVGGAGSFHVLRPLSYLLSALQPESAL